MFDYVAPVALSNAASPRRTQLNKRIAFPMSGGSSPVGGGALFNPEQGPPKISDFQILPPATSLKTPQPVPVLVPSLVPNPECSETSIISPLTYPGAESLSKPPITSPLICPGAQSLNDLVSDLGIELSELQHYIHSQFLQMLENMKDKLQGRAVEDVRRRLQVMNTMWCEGKLTNPVKLLIGNLLQALKENDIKTANQLHVSLMVDHTAEVNQWMVAVKRLIQEQSNTMSLSDQHTDSTVSQLHLFTPSTSGSVAQSDSEESRKMADPENIETQESTRVTQPAGEG